MIATRQQQRRMRLLVGIVALGILALLTPSRAAAGQVTMEPSFLAGCTYEGQPLQGAVYFTKYAFDADFSVYFTKYEYESDISVYFTKYAYSADSCGVWYPTKYKFDADMVVYVTKYKFDADFVAYQTRSEYSAGA